ncbi:hypothetical protein ACFP2T_11690 [Plantactinospora solaniradicis]|uniref:Uncharacterized protein n=1 Tax=Plantactinospora solaniradicis TaxID=1723736 RepID=A0ABW1K532_9ACTN
MVPDERIGRLLTELTEDLTPRPDPYGRVLARHRRGRRRAITGAFCAVLLLAATGVAIAGTRPGGGSDAPPAAARQPWENMLAWGDRLIRSEPRGTVGGDAAYVAALSDTLLAEQRAGRFDRLTAPVRDVRVLFVDDVGPHRVALAAFVRAQPDPGTGWPNAVAWMLADRGAGPQELGRTAVDRVGDGLAPYEEFTIGALHRPDEVAYVGVAPEGCVLTTAAVTDLDDWTPEPTGSYLVRPPGNLRPEWFQVSCDGVVRQRLRGPGSWAPTGVSDAQFAAAVAGARGRVDEPECRRALNVATGGWGYAVSALPTVVWSGRTTGAGGGFDGRATVLAAPAVDGGWLGQVEISYEAPASDGTIGTGVLFRTRTDPATPDGLLAVRLDRDPTSAETDAPPAVSLLVVAPAGAAEVRAVRGGQEIARGRVRDAGLVLTVPGVGGLVLEAIDSTGAVVGTGDVADSEGPGMQVDNWGED